MGIAREPSIERYYFTVLANKIPAETCWGSTVHAFAVATERAITMGGSVCEMWTVRKAASAGKVAWLVGILVLGYSPQCELYDHTTYNHALRGKPHTQLGVPVPLGLDTTSIIVFV